MIDVMPLPLLMVYCLRVLLAQVTPLAASGHASSCLRLFA